MLCCLFFDIFGILTSLSETRHQKTRVGTRKQVQVLENKCRYWNTRIHLHVLKCFLNTFCIECSCFYYIHSNESIKYNIGVSKSLPIHDLNLYQLYLSPSQCYLSQGQYYLSNSRISASLLSYSKAKLISAILVSTAA